MKSATPDAFAALRLPRRPWLDESEVRAAFQRLAAECHPDRAGGDSHAFAAVAAAHEILRDPVRRLRHFLSLAGWSEEATPRAYPDELMSLFARVAERKQALDRFLAKQSSAASPLARALLADECASIEDKSNEVLAEVETLRQAAFEEIRNVEPSNAAIGPGEIERLTPIASRLGFFDKWSAQLREGLLALRLG